MPRSCLIFISFAAAVLVLVPGCRGETQNSDSALESNSKFSEADFHFYACTTATRLSGGEYRYSTSSFNNTTEAVTISRTVPSSTAKLEIFEARKVDIDTWKHASGKLTLRLVNKENGPKSIEIDDEWLSLRVNKENGFCSEDSAWHLIQAQRLGDVACFVVRPPGLASSKRDQGHAALFAEFNGRSFVLENAGPENPVVFEGGKAKGRLSHIVNYGPGTMAACRSLSATNLANLKTIIQKASNGEGLRQIGDSYNTFWNNCMIASKHIWGEIFSDSVFASMQASMWQEFFQLSFKNYQEKEQSFQWRPNSAAIRFLKQEPNVIVVNFNQQD